MSWEKVLLDERQQKEVGFCKTYVSHFNHGTDGHHIKSLVARLARAIDFISAELGEAEVLHLLAKIDEFPSVDQGGNG